MTKRIIVFNRVLGNHTMLI